MTFRFPTIIMRAATLALLLAACPAQAQQAGASADATSGASNADTDAKSVDATTAASSGGTDAKSVDATTAASNADTDAKSVDATTAASSGGTDATSAASAAGARSAGGALTLDFNRILFGPAFIAAWVLFSLGCAWRVVQFMRLTRLARRTTVASGRAAFAASGPRTADIRFLSAGQSWLGRLLSRGRAWERETVFGTHPVTARVSVAFHVLLFLLPLLLPAHNNLLYKSLRVSLPSLPAPFMDVMTLVFLALGGFFLVRRILVPRVRLLSTVGDYVILLLVAAPFLTAYAAHHRWLDYNVLLMVHTFVGEALIAAIPFTKLGHMPFLIFSRLFTVSEYSLKTANRRW